MALFFKRRRRGTRPDAGPTSWCWFLAVLAVAAAVAPPSAASGTRLRPLDPLPAAAVSPFAARQVDPDVAVLADGSFVVVFEEGFSSGGVILPEPPQHGRDGDVETVVARRFDSGGRPLGPAWVVNEQTEGMQAEPVVAADPASGGFAVGWLDRGLPRLRRYDAAGQPVGSETVITEDDELAAARAQLALDTTGRALVVWESFFGQALIRTAVVEADGTVGAIRAIDTGTVAHHSRQPHVVAQPDGRFFVVWSEVGDDAIRGSILDADGVADGTVLAFPALGPVVDAIADPTGSPLVFVAAARTVSRPARWLALDPEPASVVFEQALDDVASSGFFPRLAAVLPHCLVVSTDRSGTGHRLFTIGPTASAPPSPDLEIPGAAFGAIEIAGRTLPNDNPRLLAAWTRELDTTLVVRALTTDSLQLRLGDDDRFDVSVLWRDFSGNTGDGVAVPISPDTGAFWFFDPDNLELTVKVLDGRAINGHFWVFYGSLTNVEFTLTVTDTATGATYTVINPIGQFGSFGDVEALPPN